MEDAERLKQLVGRRVAEERRANELTQQQLAERIGDVSPQYVGLVEQGRQNLTIETMVKFANALSVGTRRLFDEPESMTPNPVGRPRNS